MKIIKTSISTKLLISTIFLITTISMLQLSTFSTNVYAFVLEDEEKPNVVVEEKNPSTPLTPNGNLTLVDDINTDNEVDKQFITVISKNGNYFYIIIDRENDNENVYFLNLVDEYDLMQLIEQPEEVEEELPPPVVVEKEPEPTPEPEPIEEKESGSILPLLLLLALGGGGAYYYFNFMKDKDSIPEITGLEDDEDYENENEEEYIQDEELEE